MELRELRAFVVAAQELHFARAAERLYTSASSMSETIRKLELEFGTPLFARTTRRITLTEAGRELLERAEEILAMVDEAAAAVHAIAQGETGEIIVGVTPPAAPVLAPHLAADFTAVSPQAKVTVRRMWLPDLTSSLRGGAIDVALTCAALPSDDPSIVTTEIGSEPLLVGLRRDDPLAAQASVDLRQLDDQTLGIQASHLFPAWHIAQRDVLARAGISPPSVELGETDLAARAWTDQSDVAWIMLTGSFLTGQEQFTVLPTVPVQAVPFTISWRPGGAPRAVVERFVALSLASSLPDGWLAPANASQ